MFIEAFGFLNLFGDFFPIALSFLRNIPGAPRAARRPRCTPARDSYRDSARARAVIGTFFSLEPVRAFTDRFVSPARRLPV